MCGLIALVLLLFGGVFGFTSVGSSATVVEPQIVEVQPILEMTPTPTPAEPQLVEAEPTSEAALPEQAFACASVSEAEDVANMLALVGGAFQTSVWTEQIGSGDAKNSATWIADGYGAVAYLEYLHYDCGVSQAQIDAYYSPEGFDVLLSNYSSHELTAACSAGSVRLFEFVATFDGTDYLMNYWVEQTSPTRVAGLMLVFPASQPAKLEGYAGRLFPELPNCAAEG